MPSQRKVPSVLSIIVAYMAGLAYWFVYFTKGQPTFTGNDWLKEQLIANIWRQALQTFQIPWQIDNSYYYGVTQFMANPETSLTPDLLLITVLPNNTFFLMHWLLFFTLGFVGTVLLARKYALTSLPFLFLVAIFNFNGFIGSHLSEGHIQWSGVFLFPFFFYWLPGLADTRESERALSMLKLSLLMGWLFLNGSFHMVIWCLMFLAIVLIYRRDLWHWGGGLILLSALLGVCRLLPAAFYFPARADFVSGYPSIATLLDAFTFIYHPESPARGGSFGNLVWHEYSFYIGYVGLVFLIVGGYQYAKSKLRTVPVWWIPAALVMFMFALGDVYQIIPNSGLPFASIERVASRFLVMPFCVLLIVAAIGFAHLEQRYPQYTRLVLLLSLVSMLGEIFQSARKWRIASYEAVVGVHDVPAASIVAVHDTFLHAIVMVGWSISLLTFVGIIISLVRLQRDKA